MNERIEQLKKDCGKTLNILGINSTKSKKATDAIYAFYCGVEASAPDNFPPYVIVCLMSDRYSDLVTF